MNFGRESASISLSVFAFLRFYLYALLNLFPFDLQARDDWEDELQHVLPRRRSVRRGVRARRHEAGTGRRGARGSGGGASG